MQRTLIFVCSTTVVLTLALITSAEQQVTLRNGTTLVGSVKMDGANLVIEFDGSKVQVPFQDVATVSTAGADNTNQAQRLLLRGLEAELLSDGDNKELGLLAEAHRLAPKDPHVAFWYARGLANSGYGKGASEVFEPQRAAIIAAYPGIADRLSSQIEERLAIEKLPAPLIKRLDQIAEAAKNAGAIAAEKQAYAAYFRLVDQANEPIERSAFQINCNGEDENLESYSDGYFLFTFFRSNHFGANPCQLEISQPGLVSKTFSFQGGTQAAENVGDLRVTRLSDADRQPVVVKVVDASGKPLAGAAVTCNLLSGSGGRAGMLPATTNADGEAKLTLFPNKYYCQVTLKDYCTVSQPIEVASNAAEPTKVEAKLYLSITATIKVVWRAKLSVHPGMPQFGNDAVTTGEFEQHVGSGGRGAAPVGGLFGPAWVQLVQTGNEVQLQFQEQPMGFPNPQGGSSWVGRLDRGAEDETKAQRIPPPTWTCSTCSISRIST